MRSLFGSYAAREVHADDASGAPTSAPRRGHPRQESRETPFTHRRRPSPDRTDRYEVRASWNGADAVADFVVLASRACWCVLEWPEGVLAARIRRTAAPDVRFYDLPTANEVPRD